LTATGTAIRAGGGDVQPHRQGVSMDHPVRFGLLCAARILLGLLLLPTIPELGGGVILVVCALILTAWVCRPSL